MLLNSRVQGIGLSLVLIWILILYIQLGRYRFSPTTEPPENPPIDSLHLTESEWIETAIATAADDDFDQSSIREMCDKSEWDEAVVFTCENIIGGIGNIRQEILHCIRYAIDAGAGIVLPVINLRSESNLSDLEDGTAPMSYLFDEERFVSRVKSACPQMKIYKDIGELEKLGPVTRTDGIVTNQLRHWPMMPAYSARDRVKDVKAPAGQISLIPFERVWQYYPICHDPLLFANTFGKLLPLRADVHHLAAKILHTLSTTYSLPIDPFTQTTTPHAKTFIGIHLRAANDILSYWLGYTEQAAYYLKQIQTSSHLSELNILYIASGNSSSIENFATELSTLPSPPPTGGTERIVLTKFDLLSGPDLDQLQALTWDQLALVDYLVLERSSYFMGMADSSFAWTLAVVRRITSRAGSCGWRESRWKSHLWGTALRDEFSDLMGRHAFQWESKMWP